MRHLLWAFLLLTSCATSPGPSLHKLVTDATSKDLARRSQAFQQLMQAPLSLAPLLKPMAARAPELGHPLVAVLYRMGEGDGIPLDVVARHYAQFQWPEQFEDQNKILMAYLPRELEHTLLLRGRMAAPHLSAALENSPRREEVLRLIRHLDETATRNSPDPESASDLTSLYRALELPDRADAAHRKLQQLTHLRGPFDRGLQQSVRWRRMIESPLIHFRVAILGPAEAGGPWTQERIFAAVETQQAGGGRLMGTFDYLLFIYIYAEGTRVMLGEYASDNAGTRGNLQEHRSTGQPILIYSKHLDSYVALTLQETPTRAEAALPSAIRERLLQQLRESLSPDAALALGYGRDSDALPAILESFQKNPDNPKLARALLLLGNPAGLAAHPKISASERKLIRSRTHDNSIRDFLKNQKEE